MEIKISKILFRQDTQANWEAANPIPASGEPCYDISNKTFKIGDGKTEYKQLSTIGVPEGTAYIEEPIADNKVYGRTRASDDQKGTWVEVKKADNIKSINDLLALDYGIELDMGYKIKVKNGSETVEKEVYGFRYYEEISAGINELITSSIKDGITKLISLTGTISSDGHHDYLIPVKSDTFSVNVYLDEENKNIQIISKSNEVRTQAPLDVYILYTKD